MLDRWSKAHQAYVAKYGELLARYDWTWDHLSEEYPHPHRSVPTVVRSC